jgi:hypothetical protein
LGPQFCTRQRRQQHGSQDGNNRNNDKQLDQGEGRASLLMPLFQSVSMGNFLIFHHNFNQIN